MKTRNNKRKKQWLIDIVIDEVQKFLSAKLTYDNPQGTHYFKTGNSTVACAPFMEYVWLIIKTNDDNQNNWFIRTDNFQSCFTEFKAACLNNLDIQDYFKPQIIKKRFATTN